MFLSLHLLKWPSQPKFILAIKSLSVLPVGMQMYISSLSSPLIQDGAWNAIQAAAGMHRPYQWCKNASNLCFAKWLCDGRRTWESWDTTKQGGRLGKSLFLPSRYHWDFHSYEETQQQKLSRGSAATKVWGALTLHCWGAKADMYLHESVTPAWGRERTLSELLLSWTTETCHFPLLWARESETEFLLGSWHSLPSCCRAWWEDGRDFIHQCCPTTGSWCAGDGEELAVCLSKTLKTPQRQQCWADTEVKFLTGASPLQFRPLLAPAWANHYPFL